MKKVFGALLIFCSIFLFIGCSAQEVPAFTYRNSKDVNPKDLLSINTLFIAPAIFDDGAQFKGVKEQWDARAVESQISNAVSQTLSLTILQPKKKYEAGKVCQPARNIGADGCLVITLGQYSYSAELVRVKDSKLLWSVSDTISIENGKQGIANTDFESSLKDKFFELDSIRTDNFLSKHTD